MERVLKERLVNEILSILGLVQHGDMVPPRGYIVVELVRRLIIRRICERHGCVVTVGSRVPGSAAGYAVIIIRNVGQSGSCAEKYCWFSQEIYEVFVPGEGFEETLSIILRDIGVERGFICKADRCVYSMGGKILSVSRLVESLSNASVYRVYLGNIILSIIYRCVEEYMDGHTPGIPVWLSPIQVRFIPLGSRGLVLSENMCSILLASGYRCDIDDTGSGIGDKIRRAAAEWVPYIVSVGGREASSNTLNIRVRRTNDQVIMYPGEFLEVLNKETTGYPVINVYYPVRLSERTLW